MTRLNYGSDDWVKPIQDIAEVTAGASKLDTFPTRGLYLGTAGDLTVTLIDGTSVTLKNMAAGVWHPIAVTHVTAAANGAADILAGY